MPPKQQETKHPDEMGDFLRDLNEWGEKQYSPGHWTGGNLPPHFKYGGKLGGILLVITGLAIITCFFLLCSPFNNPVSIIDIIIGVVFLAAGLKKVRAEKKRRKGV
ncbi:MAG: hypothetical protein ACPLQO_11050 [Desulfotomaculales bacterium]